jgi:hypothetical protein
MKQCCQCKEVLPFEQFYKNKTKKDGHGTECKKCSKKLRKGRGYKNDYYKLYREKKHEKLCEYLLEHPCIDCGEDDLTTLDFDHLRNKVDNISRMIGNHVSWETILKEMEKCVVRCANCHRKKTGRETNSFRYRKQMSRGDVMVCM